MRFEPEDFLIEEKRETYMAGIQVSPYPACISFVLVTLITITGLWLNVTLLPFPLQIAVYLIYGFRVILVIWFIFSLFSYLAGRIQATSRQLSGMNLPPRLLRSVSIPIQEIKKISIRYGFFGKSFNYGSLIVHLDHKKKVFSYVKEPERVKKYLEQLLNRNSSENTL